MNGGWTSNVTMVCNFWAFIVKRATFAMRARAQQRDVRRSNRQGHTLGGTTTCRCLKVAFNFSFVALKLSDCEATGHTTLLCNGHRIQKYISTIRSLFFWDFSLFILIDVIMIILQLQLSCHHFYALALLPFSGIKLMKNCNCKLLQYVRKMSFNSYQNYWDTLHTVVKYYFWFKICFVL